MQISKSFNASPKKYLPMLCKNFSNIDDKISKMQDSIEKIETQKMLKEANDEENENKFMINYLRNELGILKKILKASKFDAID